VELSDPRLWGCPTLSPWSGGSPWGGKERVSSWRVSLLCDRRCRHQSEPMVWHSLTNVRRQCEGEPGMGHQGYPDLGLVPGGTSWLLSSTSGQRAVKEVQRTHLPADLLCQPLSPPPQPRLPVRC
jgi:hypothetical protein